MDKSERVVYKNQLGTVTSKKVILNYKGGTRDIPIEQINSIVSQRRRNYFLLISDSAFGLFILFLLFFNLDDMGVAGILLMSLFVFVAILSGLTNLIGQHDIVISTVGRRRKPLYVETAKTKDRQQFVDAVKEAIFRLTISS
jgi:hypothetical protein